MSAARTAFDDDSVVCSWQASWPAGLNSCGSANWPAALVGCTSYTDRQARGLSVRSSGLVTQNSRLQMQISAAAATVPVNSRHRSKVCLAVISSELPDLRDAMPNACPQRFRRSPRRGLGSDRTCGAGTPARPRNPRFGSDRVESQHRCTCFEIVFD